MGGPIQDVIDKVIGTDPEMGLKRDIWRGANPGDNNNQNTTINPETGEILGSIPDVIKMRDVNAKKAQQKEADDSKARELAPLQKALRDEVDFLGKRYAYGSKIGGRGLF